MACVTICAQVVEQTDVVFTDTIACTPQHTPTNIGNEAYLLITSAQAQFGPPGPRVEFSYAASIEYEWSLGMDYCFIQGSDTVSLQSGALPCTCTNVIATYTGALTNAAISNGLVTADMTITFTVDTCTDSLISVQLCTILI